MRSKTLHRLALGAAALLLVACSDTTEGGAGIDQACGTTLDCRSGLLCTAEGVCAQADESDGGDEDATSSSDAATDGDVNSDGFEVCADVDIEFVPIVPTIVLLVDRSGSMVEDFGGVTRWQAVDDVLFGAESGVVRRYDDAVRFGIVTYMSNGGSAGGECPLLTGLELTPSQGTAEVLATAFAELAPQGDTPTGEAIEGTLPVFAAVAERAPKILLLATDGEPDTCAVPNPQQGQPEAIAAAQAALQAGVRTYVLSVGSEVGEPHLQDMANAGVGLPVGGADAAPFWKADDPAGLAEAVSEIITGARPCVFALQGERLDPQRAHLGQVTLTPSETLQAQSLEHDGADGWRLHDTSPPCYGAGQCVELLGAACDVVQHDPSPRLLARFPCEAVAQ